MPSVATGCILPIGAVVTHLGRSAHRPRPGARIDIYGE
jgi:hypothetical protein